MSPFDGACATATRATTSTPPKLPGPPGSATEFHVAPPLPERCTPAGLADSNSPGAAPVWLNDTSHVSPVRTRVHDVPASTERKSPPLVAANSRFPSAG